MVGQVFVQINVDVTAGIGYSCRAIAFTLALRYAKADINRQVFVYLATAFVFALSASLYPLTATKVPRRLSSTSTISTFMLVKLAHSTYI